MKSLTQMLAVATLILCASCENDKQPEDQGMEMGKLHISKSKPQPGDEILIKYSGDQSEMPEATVNLIDEERYYPVDLEMKDSAEALYGKFKIPDSIKTIAFNFEIDDKYDSNNNSGYVLTLYDNEGEKLPGSRAIMGNYFALYGKSFDIKIEKDSSVALMESDFADNPAVRDDFDSQYTNALLSIDPKKGNSYLDERIEYYNKKDSLKAKDYEAVISLYDLKKEKKKSDSIKEIAIAKFPKSYLAKSDLMMKVVRAKDLQEKLKYYEKYNEEVGTDSYEKDIMLRYVANAYAAEKDWKNFEKYASRIGDDNMIAGLYNSIAWNMAEEGKDLEIANKLSEKSVNLVTEMKGDYSDKPEYYSNKQFDKSLEFMRSMYTDTYAFIQYKLGNIEKAAELQSMAVNERSSADVNTRYVQYLIELEDYKTAREKAENFMKNNRASAEMEEYLKKAFAETEKEGKFENYLTTIKEEARNNAMAELEKDMLNEEAPAFALKDLDGKEVTLNSLKGKTVILDFWATWCGPCIRSFPGMQKAVEKYQDNPNVEFFFVDTFENIPDRNQTVSEFINKNNYSFHVLMDEPVSEGSNTFKTADDYGISGIPTKIIIGPEGKINFRAVGYDGNNEKLVQEIGLMIDLTQKNKQPDA